MRKIVRNYKGGSEVIKSYREGGLFGGWFKRNKKETDKRSGGWGRKDRPGGGQYRNKPGK